MLSRKCYECPDLSNWESEDSCKYSGTQNGTIKECHPDHDLCQKMGNLI